MGCGTSIVLAPTFMNLCLRPGLQDAISDHQFRAYWLHFQWAIEKQYCTWKYPGIHCIFRSERMKYCHLQWRMSLKSRKVVDSNQHTMPTWALNAVNDNQDRKGTWTNTTTFYEQLLVVIEDDMIYNHIEFDIWYDLIYTFLQSLMS